MSDLSAELRTWLGETFGLDATRLKDDEALFSSGQLDSFNFIELVSEFERLSRLRVSPLDLNLANFDSLEKMSAYANRKLAQSSAR